MSNDEFNDDILDRARELATEIAPERDLWPNIEAAIDAPARPRYMPYLAQAAAVVLLVAGSSGLTWLVTKGDAPQAVANQPPVAMPQFDAEFASFGGQYALGPRYEDARNNLAAELDIELDRLSPEARADVEENLKIIRDAIDEINQALAREPDNVLLQELLLDTYREELKVMHDVGDLARNVTLRNDI